MQGLSPWECVTFLPGVWKKSWISLDLIRPGTWISRRPWHPRMPLNRSRFSFHWIGSCLREEKIVGSSIITFFGAQNIHGVKCTRRLSWNGMPLAPVETMGGESWVVVCGGTVENTANVRSITNKRKSWWDQHGVCSLQCMSTTSALRCVTEFCSWKHLNRNHSTGYHVWN